MHSNHHAKTVELRFRQRKHAFLLHRVLSRQNPEGIVQSVGGLADRHLPLLHGLQQRALRLLGSAVDFIRQNDVGEDRTLFRTELASLAVENSCSQNVGGKHIRGELNALELGVNGIRNGGDEQRFREAGHAFQQNVSRAHFLFLALLE